MQSRRSRRAKQLRRQRGSRRLKQLSGMALWLQRLPPQIHSLAKLWGHFRHGLWERAGRLVREPRVRALEKLRPPRVPISSG